MGYCSLKSCVYHQQEAKQKCLAFTSHLFVTMCIPQTLSCGRRMKAEDNPSVQTLQSRPCSLLACLRTSGAAVGLSCSLVKGRCQRVLQNKTCPLKLPIAPCSLLKSFTQGLIFTIFVLTAPPNLGGHITILMFNGQI